jgi:hypothetical protein
VDVGLLAQKVRHVLEEGEAKREKERGKKKREKKLIVNVGRHKRCSMHLRYLGTT